MQVPVGHREGGEKLSKSEDRFEGKHNEMKDASKDRLKNEVFLIENAVHLQFFPSLSSGRPVAAVTDHHKKKMLRTAGS